MDNHKVPIRRINIERVPSDRMIESNEMAISGSRYKTMYTAGMLTGRAIDEAIHRGEIEIDPFDPTRINPNSYNVRLANDFKIYDINRRHYSDGFNVGQYTFDEANGITPKHEYIDSKINNQTIDFHMEDEGLIMYPGVLYLGHTIERTASDYFIPMINGRSSIGRLGMSIHVTAGFGDIGFNGTWTLEITVVEPLKIYPNMEVAQVSFYTPYGDTTLRYNGRYQHQKETTPSRFYKGSRYEYDHKI